jgi:hypothetical protein
MLRPFSTVLPQICPVLSAYTAADRYLRQRNTCSIIASHIRSVIRCMLPEVPRPCAPAGPALGRASQTVRAFVIYQTTPDRSPGSAVTMVLGVPLCA